MLKMEIEPNFYLRQLAKQDVQELFFLVQKNRPYLKKFLPWLDLNTELKHSQEFFDRSQKLFIENGAYNLLLIFHEKIIGIIGPHTLNANHRFASLGYWLDEDHNGKGLMTKACIAVINDCFTRLNLNKIEIRAASQNIQSQAIPKRLGFTHEGTLRQNEWIYDHFVDHEVYSVLKSEWKFTA